MHVRSLGLGAVNAPDMDALKAKFIALRAQVRVTTNPKDKLELLTALVNVIGQFAANAPTPDLATRWMAQYRALFATLGTLRAQVSDNPPSAFMLALSAFSDKAIAVGTEAVNIVGTAAKGVATVLPVAVLGVLAVAGLVAFGYVKHGGVRIRRS